MTKKKPPQKSNLTKRASDAMLKMPMDSIITSKPAKKSGKKLFTSKGK